MRTTILWRKPRALLEKAFGALLTPSFPPIFGLSSQKVLDDANNFKLCFETLYEAAPDREEDTESNRFKFGSVWSQIGYSEDNRQTQGANSSNIGDREIASAGYDREHQIQIYFGLSVSG